MKLTTRSSVSGAWRASFETQVRPSVAICQRSLSSTSATATLNLLRSRAVSDRTNWRFPFREPFSGKRRLTRQTPTVTVLGSRFQVLASRPPLRPPLALALEGAAGLPPAPARAAAADPPVAGGRSTRGSGRRGRRAPAGPDRALGPPPQ